DGRPHRARDGVGRCSEGGANRRRDGGRRFEAQLKLPTAGHGRPLARRWRGEVLVRRRQSRHEAAELEVAEQLENRGTVIRCASGALELERHRQLGHDRRKLPTLEDLVLVCRQRFTQARRVPAEIGVYAFEVRVLADYLLRGLVAHPWY